VIRLHYLVSPWESSLSFKESSQKAGLEYISCKVYQRL
jgi:hypothetical protein